MFKNNEFAIGCHSYESNIVTVLSTWSASSLNSDDLPFTAWEKTHPSRAIDADTYKLNPIFLEFISKLKIALNVLKTQKIY